MKNFIYKSVFIVLIFVITACNDKTTELKVMSYNIHIASPPSYLPAFTHTDLEAIADVINREKPDLVGLQEVDVYTNRSGKYSHQAKDLAEMTGMYYCFAGAVERSGGVQGNAILSKYPIKQAEIFKLPTPEESNGETRSLAVVVIEIDGVNIAFITVHLDHMSDENRGFQVTQMLEYIKKYDKYPIILSGDFNMKPDNKIFKLIEQEFMMITKEPPFTFSSTNPKSTIDYLLLNKKANDLFEVLDYYTVDEQYASDHLPLILELSVPRNN